MTCTSCGAPTRLGATFCGTCGARLAAATSPVVPLTNVATDPPVAPTLKPPPPPTPPPPPPAPATPHVSMPTATTPPPVVAVSPAAVSPSAMPGSAMIDVPTFGGPPISAPPLLPPPPPPQPPPSDTLDDRTRVAPPRRPRGIWRLVLPDGTSHPISATTVIGRQPDAAAAPGATKTLAIDDPDGLVSKSHAVLELERGALAVRDLGSTNGVVALSADGAETDVTSATATPLDDGYEIELGSYVIRIEKA